MAFGWDDAAKVAGPALGLIAGIGAGKRQIKQQKKLNELGIDAYRQQRQIDQANQMEMWNATNVGAQIEHMKDAGMSISAMYGGSGGGGTTAGSGGGSAPIGTADGEVARQQMGLQLGRQAAELALMKAQTKKTEAEAENLAETKGNITADTAAKVWATELSKKLNQDTFIADIQGQQKWATEKIKQEFQKENQEWEAAMAAGFTDEKGNKMTFNDPQSPAAKAMRAGFERTITEAENAKKAGKVLDAEKTIKEFEANLTRQGIAAGSPWYVKIVGDLFRKIGINLTGDTANGVKTVSQ